MPKNSDLQKHTLNLNRGDFDKIGAYYPDVPAATIIRRVISAFVKQIEESGDASVNASVEIKI